MRNILNQMESSTCRIHYHCNFLVDEISSWSQRSVFGIATRLRSGQQRIRSYIHAGEKVFIIFRPSKTYRGALCLLLSGHRWLLPRDKATRAWSWPPICFFDEVKNELKYTATRTHVFIACTGKSVRLYQIYRHSHTSLHSMYREECASLSNRQGCKYFPKIYEPTQNSRHPKGGDTEQVPYRELTNIRLHHKQCIHPGDWTAESLVLDIQVFWKCAITRPLDVWYFVVFWWRHVY